MKNMIKRVTDTSGNECSVHRKNRKFLYAPASTFPYYFGNSYKVKPLFTLPRQFLNVYFKVKKKLYEFVTDYLTISIATPFILFHFLSPQQRNPMSSLPYRVMKTKNTPFLLAKTSLLSHIKIKLFIFRKSQQ